MAIVAAREFQWVFSAVNRSNEPRVASFDFSKTERRVGTYYFYVLAPDFGPGFIKMCTYIPVRHESPFDRVECRDPPAACRSRSLKLRAA